MSSTDTGRRTGGATGTPVGPGEAPAEMAGRLRYSVIRLARLLRQQDESGLSLTLTASLATIAREGPLTLGELAAHEQVAPPSITKVVAKLEAQGLVTRSADPDDRRVSRVEISSDGRRQLEANRHRRTAWLESRLRELDPADVAHLEAAVEVLEQLVAAPAEQGGSAAR
jgi:DNA-binding MarR family transcriptional regulator